MVVITRDNIMNANAISRRSYHCICESGRDWKAAQDETRRQWNEEHRNVIVDTSE
jgi:hypothetical protein